MGYGFGPSTDAKPTQDKPKRPIYSKQGGYICPYCGNKLSLQGFSPGFGPGPGHGPGNVKK